MLTNYLQRNDTEEDSHYLLQRQLDGEYNTRFYAVFDAENEELMSFNLLEIQGDVHNHENGALFKMYEVDGDEVEEYEDSILELVNENLNLQLDLAEFVANGEISTQQSTLSDGCSNTGVVDGAVVCGLASLGTGVGFLAVTVCAWLTGG